MTAESPFCGNCGARLRPDAKFCHRCGVDFKLFKSTPFTEPPKNPVRHTKEYTAITEERIRSLSDKNLQAALERELGPNIGKLPSTGLPKQPTIPANVPASHKPGERLPFRAVALIIVLISVAVLGVIGVAAWNHRGLLGRRLNSSVPPKASQRASDVFFQTYDVTLTTKTQFPDRALGSPDGKFAIVSPGGKLVLRAMEPFTDVPGADVEVVGQSGNRARYRISCYDLDHNRWQRLDIGTGQGRHDLGGHNVHQSNQIQIENISSDPLLIDSVRIRR